MGKADEREQASQEAHFQVTNTFMMEETSEPDYFLEIPPPNTLRRAIPFQHDLWGAFKPQQWHVSF